MKKVIFILLISVSIGNGADTSIGGYVDFAHIGRLSDYSIIDIPYRMGSLEFEHQSDKLSLNGNFVLEYQIRDDTYFLGSKDPQDFRLDMRELYMTYNGSNYEFRVGKQIHSWGNVDENSPLDNASAFDYYYIFFLGTERKMATMSGALDYYLGNLKLNAIFSPLHSTNRLPLGDDDFPITLPIYPEPLQIFPIQELPLEGGIYGVYSHSKGEISFSYYSGYDRVFNFSGVNQYYSKQWNSFKPSPDLVFGYRKTNIYGFGTTFLNDYFILRGDIGIFNTNDQNSTIEREDPNPISFYDSLAFSYPMSEKATYRQTTLQIETELPLSINFIAQYFNHEMIDYNSADTLPDVEIDIPGFVYNPEEMSPEDLFTPGMGVPLAVITNKAGIIIIDKMFLNEELKLSVTSMLDLEKYTDVDGIAGSLTEYKIEYNIAQDLLGLIGMTKVIGTDDHPDGENYQFNKMEDFSHFRFEIKYFF